MKITATAFLLSAFAVTAASAQTPPPVAPAPAATTPATAAAPPASGAQAPLRQVAEQCRTQIRDQKLRGDAHRDAMMQCMLKARPDRAAAIKCQFDPQIKGMAREARRTFVRACIAKAKG